MARRPDSPRIDLLLTDVVMPELGGRELADRLRAQYPDIKVVFFSGYPGDALGHRGMVEPGLTLIQKPFSPEELARKVRQSLDGIQQGQLMDTGKGAEPSRTSGHKTFG